jgi:hypothetical protein
MKYRDRFYNDICPHGVKFGRILKKFSRCMSEFFSQQETAFMCTLMLLKATSSLHPWKAHLQAGTNLVSSNLDPQRIFGAQHFLHVYDVLLCFL